LAVTVAPDPAALVELDYLAEALVPPCQLGPFMLTGRLARSARAVLFTARYDGRDVVLKLTGTAFAPGLARELELLTACADADVPNVVRPVERDLVWLFASGDRPAAALVLPLLSGGDLGTRMGRAARNGQLGPALALEAARPLANALRGLLCDLHQPLLHGDLRVGNVLLPSPTSPLADLALMDLDRTRELEPTAAAAEVRALGAILCLLATGQERPGERPIGGGPFKRLLDRCLRGEYASLADRQFWRDLAACP
jgi:hypothetical protein